MRTYWIIVVQDEALIHPREVKLSAQYCYWDQTISQTNKLLVSHRFPSLEGTLLDSTKIGCLSIVVRRFV